MTSALDACLVKDLWELCTKLLGRLDTSSIESQEFLLVRRRILPGDDANVDALLVVAAGCDLGGVPGAELLTVREGNAREALQQRRLP